MTNMLEGHMSIKNLTSHQQILVHNVRNHCNKAKIIYVIKYYYITLQ